MIPVYVIGAWIVSRKFLYYISLAAITFFHNTLSEVFVALQFGQIAEAIKECQAVVACVSQEYADSDNCRMEIQFAAKSLGKPLVAVVVGKEPCQLV